MSHSENYTDTGHTSAFYQGKDAGIRQEQERIIKLIDDTYSNPKTEEWGSFEWTSDIIDLIKGEQK